MRKGSVVVAARKMPREIFWTASVIAQALVHNYERIICIYKHKQGDAILNFRFIAIITFTVLLGGCVSPPQQPIALNTSTLSSKANRIGVAMTTLPKVDTHLVGAGCLLCIMTASIANSALTTHSQTLPYEDLPKLKNEAADILRKRGADVVLLAEDINLETLPSTDSKEPNTARKDFSSLRAKYQVDRLLVIEIQTLGMWRTYSAYIPTSDPKGVLQGTGYIVNLHNNTYEWYLPVDITKSADKNWDEPPKFPGLTNAYFQALEIGRDSFLKPLGN